MVHKTKGLFDYFQNREIGELYASIGLRSFGLGLIAVFIPIFLLKLNYSLKSIFIFYAIFYGVHALMAVPAVKTGSKYGFKHTMLFSIPFVVLGFILLYTLEQFNWPLALIGFSWGISSALFWTGFHVDFAFFSENKKRGSQVGFAKIVASGFAFLGPIIGGVVLSLSGFKILFVVVTLILLLSAWPLFFSEEITSKTEISLREMFSKKRFKDFIGLAGLGIEGGVAAVAWPIFIFTTILGGYASLGLVTSITLLSSSVFVFIVGKASDRHRTKILKIGAGFSAVIWAVKSLVTTPFQVFVIDGFYGAANAATRVPFDAISYDKAHKQKSIIKTIAFREIGINVGGAVFFLIMAFTSNLIGSFIWGGSLGALLMLLF